MSKLEMSKSVINSESCGSSCDAELDQVLDDIRWGSCNNDKSVENKIYGLFMTENAATPRIRALKKIIYDRDIIPLIIAFLDNAFSLDDRDELCDILDLNRIIKLVCEERDAKNVMSFVTSSLLHVAAKASSENKLSMSFKEVLSYFSDIVLTNGDSKDICQFISVVGTDFYDIWESISKNRALSTMLDRCTAMDVLDMYKDNIWDIKFNKKIDDFIPFSFVLHVFNRKASEKDWFELMSSYPFYMYGHYSKFMESLKSKFFHHATASQIIRYIKVTHEEITNNGLPEKDKKTFLEDFLDAQICYLRRFGDSIEWLFAFFYTMAQLEDLKNHLNVELISHLMTKMFSNSPVVYVEFVKSCLKNGYVVSEQHRALVNYISMNFDEFSKNRRRAFLEDVGIGIEFLVPHDIEKNDLELLVKKLNPNMQNS